MVGTLWHSELNFPGLHRGFVSLGLCSHWLARVPRELDINAIERFLDLWPRFLATIYVPFFRTSCVWSVFSTELTTPKTRGT